MYNYVSGPTTGYLWTHYTRIVPIIRLEMAHIHLLKSVIRKYMQRAWVLITSVVLVRAFSFSYSHSQFKFRQLFWFTYSFSYSNFS